MRGLILNPAEVARGELEELKREAREKYGYPRMSVAHGIGAVPILVTDVVATMLTPSGVLVLEPDGGDVDSFRGAHDYAQLELDALAEARAVELDVGAAPSAVEKP